MASHSELKEKFRQCIGDSKLNCIPEEFQEDVTVTWSKKQRSCHELKYKKNSYIPSAGTELPTGTVRYAGNYLLGPIIGAAPVHSMVQCLARRKDKDEFFYLKILTIKNKAEANQDDKQGKLLLHTEHSLLSLLADEPGVIKQYGLFQDYGLGVTVNRENNKVYSTGTIVRRMCLVLECVVRHEYDQRSLDFINLQHYVIFKKKLKETEALFIFASIVKVVERLHILNVVHRDLKLANLIYNQRKRTVTLTNFCLGQHLVSGNERLEDQRGSPAYISPDVLSGRSYLGKPSDMWALGVVLYTMLFGQFPFYHEQHRELFIKIKSASFTIPSDTSVRGDTLELIKGLLKLDPARRLTATQVMGILTPIITARMHPGIVPDAKGDQLVPQLSLRPATRDALSFVGKKRKCVERGVSDDEGDSLSQQVVPQDPIGTPGSNMSAIYSRRLDSYCYSHPDRLNYSYAIPQDEKNTTKFTEGDIRSLTTDDIIANRNVFSLNAGSELFRAWKSTANIGTNPGKTRVSRYAPTGTTSTSSRTTSRSTVPVNPGVSHLPSRSNVTSGLYEFLRARRCAMVAMNKINSQSDEIPTVPEPDVPVNDGCTETLSLTHRPSSADSLNTRESNERNPGLFEDVTDEQISASNVSIPSTSGVNQFRLPSDSSNQAGPSTSSGFSGSREGPRSPLAARRLSMSKNNPSKFINLSLTIGRMETVAADGTPIDNEDENSMENLIAELASGPSPHDRLLRASEEETYDGDEIHSSTGEVAYNSDSSTDSNADT